MPHIWLNGNFLDESAAMISIRDTGLLHAAGVFTTMRSANGRVFRLEQHLARLRESCEALFIPLQHRDATLIATTRELLAKNDLSNARLRLTVTRGMATDDPLHGMRLEPTAFLTAAPFEPYPTKYYQSGMTVILLDEQKLNPYDVQAGHKTLNYFSRLSALKSANTRRAGEALWFNVHNYLQSGSISNVFIVKADKLITPPTPREMQDPAIRDAMPYPKSNVLPGVTRAAILDFARKENIGVETSAIDVNRLLDADEVFITNSIMGVMPVCRIERKEIGNGNPGPLTQKLASQYQSAVEDAGAA
ncbi:MAG TPA: aminotransferase class IV [Tepidisphaeraceae bacterium]|jgi:branched-chain amino acid aminotransferase|nr:aminotransferase class IV [Tepidisphaeraceae bacterium]